MKRILFTLLALILSFTVVFALTACGDPTPEVPTPEAPESYTVTFDSNGGTDVAAQTVTSAEKATEPTPPTKDGYTFLGWYLGDEKWSFTDYVVTEDITLTAKWESNEAPVTKYTVTFDSDGGSSVADQTVESGKKATKPEAPTKDGYDFLGWYLGDEKWSFTDYIVTEDITLTAKWEISDDAILGEFDPEKPITITFYHSMGKSLRDVLDASIEEFNEKYPNITIEHESYGSYDGVLSQIKAELSVGDHPDLAYCYADHLAVYNLTGATQTLDIFMNDEAYGFTEAELGNFFDGVLDDGKVFGDDKTYLIPIAKSTEVLYYNKTFFEKHDLTVPTTWDEMETLLEQIKALDPSCIPLGYDSESNLFINLVNQLGLPYTDATADDPFTFNTEAARAVVERLRTWYQNRWITTEQLSGDYTSSLFTGNSYSGVCCYMTIGSTGGATYNQPTSRNGVYDFEVGIAPIPQFDKTNPKVISQGPSICTFKNEDSQKIWASWLFLKHLATDEVFQAAISISNGYAPVIRSVIEEPDYAAFLAGAVTDGTKNIQAYAVTVALEQYGAMFTTDAFYGSSIAREQVGLLIQNCLTYEGDDAGYYIKFAFERAIAECNYQTGRTTTPPKTEYDPTAKYFNENGELILFKDGIPTFQFVVGADAILSNLATVEDLADTLSELSKSDVDVKADSEASQDVEILIGTVTNRGDEYLIDKSEYSEQGFAVKQIGTKIVVVAANNTSLERAINYLRATVFGIKKLNNPFDDLVMSVDKNYDEK